MAKILLVEDHAETQDSLTVCLELAGHNVLAAKNGLEALTAMSEETPDVIITDAIMPELGGLDLVKALRAPQSRFRLTPILMLTGYYSELAREALRAGADKVLRKPTDPQAILATVKVLLELCDRQHRA